MDVVLAATRFFSDSMQSFSEKYGIRAKRHAEYLSAQVRGKKIRNVDDALRAYNRNMRGLGVSDRRAIATAIRSVKYSVISENLKKFSVALGYFGKVLDVVGVIQAIATSVETGSMRPALVKIETLAAGKVATALVAFAFSIALAAPLGILGYAVLIGLVGALVNDSLVEKINLSLGL